jgi:transcriptional regulator with PAS, ATPase and Fis domain
MKEECRKIASTPYSVLIVGETGTGKELIANSMIANRLGKIQAINCAGMPRDLIESELFGHTQGAFTGAIRAKDGLLMAAKDGVMFLDEIGDMPMDIQAKLLRAMQQMVVRKVGGTTDEKINCKFVCATNCNLRDMVTTSRFRRDLFARISTLEVDIKPLRERVCDLEPIVMSILPDGPAFWEKYGVALKQGDLDLSLNVRSIQQHVIRYSVLGRVSLKS